MYIFTKWNQRINLKNFKKKQASNYSSNFNIHNRIKHYKHIIFLKVYLILKKYIK